MATSGRAIVANSPLENDDWQLEDIVLDREPEADELIVRMVASGICHTDLALGSVPDGVNGTKYPMIFGHEGSGYVEKVGSSVTVAKAGDPVLLSFNSCKDCSLCKDDHPAYCDQFAVKNFLPYPGYQSEKTPDKKIGGGFFGQSSFSSVSIVSERSVVNVKDIIKDKEELIKLSPLGCGLQTGSGTVLNIANAQERDSVAVLGLGGVGLGAIMAAKIAGVKTIIGIDRVESRLQMAKDLGATHAINTTGWKSLDEMPEVVAKEAGEKPTVVIDTTGVDVLMRKGYEMTRNKGQFVQLGVVPPGYKFDFDMTEFMLSGKQIRGGIEGDAIPADFVPQMVKWWKEGKFPFDRFIKTFKVEDFKQAIHEMHTGETIKPIVVW